MTLYLLIAWIATVLLTALISYLTGYRAGEWDKEFPMPYPEKLRVFTTRELRAEVERRESAVPPRKVYLSEVLIDPRSSRSHDT